MIDYNKYKYLSFDVEYLHIQIIEFKEQLEKIIALFNTPGSPIFNLKMAEFIKANIYENYCKTLGCEEIKPDEIHP